MPEFIQKRDHMGEPTGSIDWHAFFLSMAAGAILVMQGWSQMQHNETKQDIKAVQSQVMPKQEVEYKARNLTQKIESLETRLDMLEKTLLNKK